MTQEPIPAINFTISDNAKRGIEQLRRSFDAHASDAADVPTIGWARYKPSDGTPYENVAVTFYSRSQRQQIASAIQEVSGIEIVYLPVPADHAKFEGKVLDWSQSKGFFLRQP